MKLIRFLKDWTLIISILAGIAGYFIYTAMPFTASVKADVNKAVNIVQPLLIFLMLFLTFSRIEVRKLRMRTWHLWLLCIQCGLFTLIGCILILIPHSGFRIVLEGAMICLICPTATAGAVITQKLGGNVNDITTYTILINLSTAILIPALVPFVHPNPDITIWTAAILILSKVFPILLFPLLAAIVTRHLFPRFNSKIASHPNISFYLWAVSLSLATAITTRSIVHTDTVLSTQIWLTAISLICCGAQFYIGRKIGALYHDTITAGQSLGQKNTVFAIWVGYSFFTPITSIAGGFYSIWHNIVNSYQLYKHHKGVQQSSSQHQP